MKLPSIEQIWQETRRTVLRFLLVIVNAALGTLAAIILIEKQPSSSPYVKILYATLLGIPLLTSVALVAEKRKWRIGAAAGCQIFSLLLLIAYGYSAPSALDAPAMHLIRLVLLAVAAHLFVAVAPFSAAGELNGFWQYNKTLLYRIMTAVFYSGVLFVGFAIALAALDQLFGVNIPPKRYAELWVIMAGMFNTTFFLAGIPENLDDLEQETDYPKSLKIFVQYILTPLVIIYLIILYAYVAKIVMQWSWPKGWVSKLILGFSATGILSLLLLYPVREHKEYKWVQLAWHWFFVILIPLIIMLPLAVWRRTSQYGVTEGRYLAVTLAICLALLTVYFILSKAKNIKVIPALLCLITLFVSYGSWSVFAASEKSQIGRLEKLLTAHNILIDGKIRKADKSITTEDAVQISSIISYLHEMHGYAGIQPWFAEKLDGDSTGTMAGRKYPTDVVALMGIEFMHGKRQDTGDIIILSGQKGKLIDISGYDRMLAGQFISAGGTEQDVPGAELFYAVSDNLDSIKISVFQPNMPPLGLRVCLRPLYERLNAQYGNTNPETIPLEEMTICAADKKLKVKIYLRHISLEDKDQLLKPLNYTIDILYALKNK
jgi:hypothetical protein